jgi:hypothetical protein
MRLSERIVRKALANRQDRYIVDVDKLQRFTDLLGKVAESPIAVCPLGSSNELHKESKFQGE